MNWFILLSLSFVSAALVAFALWPSSPDKASRKKLAVLLALSVILLPAGLNYYVRSDGAAYDAATDKPSFTLPEMKKSVWSAPAGVAPSPAAGDMSLAGVTARLKEKLRRNPDNISGWVLLGRSYAALGQTEKAVSLFEGQIGRHPDNIDLLLSYGETLSQLNNQMIPAEAQALFLKAGALSPGHPRAEYNLALFDMQHGDHRAAHDRLKDLLEKAPANAAWTKQARTKMAEAAAKIGLNETPANPSPSPEQMSAAAAMSPQDRAAFINSMVARLADKLQENPDDLQGWIRLGKSYGVLGDWQEAARAYKRAQALAPTDGSIRKLYENALNLAKKK